MTCCTPPPPYGGGVRWDRVVSAICLYRFMAMLAGTGAVVDAYQEEGGTVMAAGVLSQTLPHRRCLHTRSLTGRPSFKH